MIRNYEVETRDIKEATIEALKLAKGVLSGELKITPKVVGKFTALSGFTEVEVFMHVTGESDELFRDNDEYEENIYYIVCETGDIVKVEFEELEQLMKTFIGIELGRGIYIGEDEKDEYRKLKEVELDY